MSSSSESSSLQTSTPSGAIRFRLVHILYFIALFSTALATFGIAGIAPAVLVLMCWAYIFSRPNRELAFSQVAVVILLGGCIFSCLLPAVQTAREGTPRPVCMNNLKQIAWAIEAYNTCCGSFPPPYFTDENGHPTHSWRVLLLPFLDQAPLYKRYRFDEPWNGPNNIKLLESMPSVYACPTGVHAQRKRFCTSYVAVVAPNTIWPSASKRRMADIKDGTANTVMVVESNQPEIPWLKPQDLEFEEALAILSSKSETSGGHRSLDFFYEWYSGRCVACADGRTSFVPLGVDRSVWSAMLGIDDVQTWSDEDFGKYYEPPTQRLRIENCVRLGMFVFVALLPLPWVWLPRSRSRIADFHIAREQALSDPKTGR